MGAKGRGDPAYHGEVYTVGGGSHPRIESFTPNEVVVEVDDAKPGDVLVLNQNYYAGWSRTAGPSRTTRTRSRPCSREVISVWCFAAGRRLAAGLVIFVLTVGVLGRLAWMERRKRRAPSVL